MTNTYSELRSTPSPLARPDRVLTIGAHPDDAEFGAGATVARWAAGGTDVTMCIVTDGSMGSWDPDMDPSALARRRTAEQERAADLLGVSQVVYLGHVDGELEYSTDLRRELASQVRLHRPDVVFTHDPWQRYQLHPDHRAVGMAAVDGIVTAREPLAMRESGLDAHRPSSILLWSADQPDHAEPVDAVWFERKVEALLCHSSQAGTTMGDADAGEAERERFVERMQRWHEESGVQVGTGPAETFKRLTP